MAPSHSGQCTTAEAVARPYGLNWFAVSTKPRQESIALENLQRQGYECFLPRVERALKARRRKAMPTAEALFPGYLFIQADPAHKSLAPVRSTRGVLQMVRFGFRLAIVPERMIELLKSRICEDTGLIQLSNDRFEAGDNVRVLDGPLQGLSGVFREHSNDARVILLLNFLGRETRVKVDSHLLERA